LLLFAFALTGYLLPWDQKGYWATQVATSLLGAMPAAGPWLKRLVQGGSEYGNLTLTRFYALHTLVLPALMIGGTVVHVALMRRHGVTPGWRKADADAAAQPFWPYQLLRDLTAMALVLAVMFALVWRNHGTGLEAPADPGATYDARPEWYFLPLYQLLKYFPGRWEVVAAIGAPLLAGGMLIWVPLADRGPSRDPRQRKRYLAAVLSLLIVAVVLGALAEQQDAGNAGFRRFRAAADQQAARALALARQGVPPAGGTAVYQNDPTHRGRTLFAEKCAGCHVLGGVGERKAPDLDGWSSRGWIAAFLRGPSHERFYGKTKIHGMKPVTVTGRDLEALVEWVWSRGGVEGADVVKMDRGEEVFDEQDCGNCHDVDGTTGYGDGTPNLGGRGSAEWIRAFVADPSGKIFFGKLNEMPKFGSKLSEAELDAVVALLRGERGR
jgi:ubiquinol-cytochrome c reductase cytochrome b subunit